MYRILVVANETLTGDHLVDEVRERAAGADGDAAIHIVVPASHGTGAWTEGGAKADAQARLEAAIERFGPLASEVTGEVGDTSPVLAVSDAFIGQRDKGGFDEIVISTWQAGVSRWLHQDAVSRIIRAHSDIPVTHLVAPHQRASG
jgi:hypothetical protein